MKPTIARSHILTHTHADTQTDIHADILRQKANDLSTTTRL